MRASVRTLVLLSAVLACGDGAGDRPPPDEPPPLPAAASGTAPAQAGAEAGTSEAAPTAASAPAPAARSAPGQDTSTWSAGIVAQAHPGPPATLRAIRVAPHAGFERVVFEFRDRLPSYQVEYVDRPVRACGSGNVVPVAGEAWLQVRFQGAQAHDEAGRPTVAAPRVARLANLRELRSTCDFEGDVTWVLGLARPNRYRTLELQSPARLVVDILAAR